MIHHLSDAKASCTYHVWFGAKDSWKSSSGDDSQTKTASFEKKHLFWTFLSKIWYTTSKEVNAMIYLDHAATTMPKPPQVIEAVTRAMTTFGNASRGGHSAALDASRAVYRTRGQLSDFFHGYGASSVIFTANATESLNLVLNGLFEDGDHVITTDWEHNSVLRPLYRLQDTGKLSVSF